MLKIIQINTSANTGSTGRIAEEIGQLAVSKGFDTYMAYGRVNRNSQLKTIKIGSSIDSARHLLFTRLLDNHGFSSTSATRAFIRQLEMIKPDLIHFHNLHGYYLNVEILFNYLSKYTIPVVWTLHDCWPLTGHCSYFDFVNCDKWKTACSHCPNSKGYPTSYIDRSKLNFLKKKQLFTSIQNITFVTPSKWLEKIVNQSFFSEYQVQTIHNGVDLNLFKFVETTEIRSKYLLGDTKIILGVASVWDRRKGLSDFIKLSKQIDSNTIIVLVGITEDQKKELPSNIISIARTENIKELAAFYSVAHVFANPTWVDNFPTTNIEALACGTPVITYSTGGSPEAISEDTGYVVPKGDITAFYYAIKQILKREKAEFQTACRQRAERMYNKDDRYSDYVQLYHHLLKKQE